MTEPLVSIITPFKNTAEYLVECLTSIVKQSYGNWELLIVNDHSSDNSRQIVHNFSKEDRRIKLYNNLGSGIIPALQTAFANSKGELITRMDSDDIMAIDKLESMVKDLQVKGKGNIALGKVKYFSDQGINDGYLKYQNWLNNLTETGSNFLEIYKECVIPSPCWMTYKADFITAGGFNSNTYPEDYDLTFRFYKSGLKCIASNRILHYWRDYPTRTSRTHIHYAQNYFLDIKFKYFIELDYNANRPLTLWGAGTKGKTIAKKLINSGINFHWICNNPNKIGKKIYGQRLLDFKSIEKFKQPQSIVTVANTMAQKKIKEYFAKNGLNNMIDYFFFC